MKLKIDTHIHSEKSADSRQTTAEIAAACLRCGIDGVVVCDHDISYAGAQKIDGIYFLPGIEISTEYGHLLGLCIDSPVAPVRDFSEAVKRIKDANGLAVLAHPYENHHFKKSDIDGRLKKIAPLLDGIEVFNSRAAQFVNGANAYAAEAAELYDKPSLAGSDAHLPCEIGGSFVEIEVTDPTCENIRSALLEKGNKLFTRGTSKRINTAKSQFIKLRKTNAPLKKYIKFSLFAAKCLLYDILRFEKKKLRQL